MINIAHELQSPYAVSNQQADIILNQLDASKIVNFANVQIVTTAFLKHLIDSLSIHQLQQIQFVNLTKHSKDKLELVMENHILNHDLTHAETTQAIFG